MKRTIVLISFLLAAITLPALAQTQPLRPLTDVNIHIVGPVKLGNQPAVIVPANNPQTSKKIQLGRLLYFDTRLSRNNTISCATCHDPAMGWSDKGPTSTGIEGKKGGRRSPPVSNAAYSPLQFWDGRSPSLEDQAKGPVANPIEMGNTHNAMIRTVNDIPGYVDLFQDLFGVPTISVDMVAEAIASFERTVVTTDSPFDRYVRGDENALTAFEKKGLEVFNGKGHCTACHWGGNFSDGRFHNLGVTPTKGEEPDQGRIVITKDPKDMGAFKTPTVRDAALRLPYMHNGSEMTLMEVVELYNEGGRTGDPNLDPLILPLGLSSYEKNALVAFMTRALTSTNPEVATVKPPAPSEFPK